MNFTRITTFLLILLFLSAIGCRRQKTDVVTAALAEPFSTLDSLTSTSSEAAAERMRSLIFNSLLRKNEKFEYVGELASEYSIGEDGTTITFRLRDGVKFHNGKEFTAADVKYTFDTLFASKAYKAGSFFETIGNRRQPHITSLTTPDPKTVVFVVAKTALINKLLSNLVAIPIIAEGTAGQQSETPIGTGPFKFVFFDRSQNIVELAANPDYWDGPPKFPTLRVKTVSDASALQAELKTGGVDIAPAPTNLTPDTIKQLASDENLKVDQFEGSNIQYLGFNTESATVDDKRIRQAIAYGIDREKIISELLSGQAKLATSILPPSSWAYSPGKQYPYDPARAKALLREAGYKNQPIKFKYSSRSAAYNNYAQAIQSSLIEIGLNVQIETVDPQTLLEQIKRGQFQMNMGIWIGGNQDPIFLKDLFSSHQIPSEEVPCCNRGRYRNPEVDQLLDEAVSTTNRNRARELYTNAWEIISDDLPLFPLWYPSNIVVANKRLGNIKMNASGDWTFLKDVTLSAN
ncbi:MAG: hypothetical protein C4324_11025 [Blastocatellia bacterium]